MKLCYNDLFTGNATPILDAVNQQKERKNMILEGKVLKVDTFGPWKDKHGEDKYRYDGSLYDGTHTVYFSFFAKRGVPIKKGMDVQMKGEFIKNKYKENIYGEKGEWCLQVTNIQEKESTVTNSPKDPRIEFQTFNFFTEMRGAVSPKNLVKAAKKRGMDAITITDVSVAQAFPEAYYAGKDEGIKVNYGMTGLMVDIDPIVHHPTNQLLNETEYVVFDVETTGFSSRFHRVFELAGVRCKKKYVCEKCQFEETLTEWETFCSEEKRSLDVCPTCAGYGKRKKKADEEDKKTVSVKLVKEAEFSKLVRVDQSINAKIEELTNVNDQMILEEGEELQHVIDEFRAFKGDAVLVAHNATFDMAHLNTMYQMTGYSLENEPFVDTLPFSKAINTDYAKHGLAFLAKKEKVKNDNHHRALNDAIATMAIFSTLLQKAQAKGVTTFEELNALVTEDQYKFNIPYEVTILVQTQQGLKNLYKLISASHQRYLSSVGKINKKNRYPVITWALFNEHKEGLLIGSGSHKGRVFKKALERSVAETAETIRPYDFIEIQPEKVATHLWHSDYAITDKEEYIKEAWKTVYEEAKKQEKMVISTGHVHYIEKDEQLSHNMLLYSGKGGKEIRHEYRPGKLEYLQGECHLRSTEEMMEGLSWLSKEEAYEVVVTNTQRLNEQIEAVQPIPDKLYTPEIKGADEKLREIAMNTLHNTYGNPAPKHVQERLELELSKIIDNGYGVIYYISHLLVEESLRNGYMVGSRGSIGSSFAATMTNITEVNPLTPHYLCKSCQWSMFIDHPEVRSGFDLPNRFKDLFTGQYSDEAKTFFMKTFKETFQTNNTDALKKAIIRHAPNQCPKCKENTLRGDGQSIPFETFLGFDGDKVPDIDLNFSGEYQPKAHKFIQEQFGAEYVFRAGTIGTVAEKTAFSIARKYVLSNKMECTKAELERLADGLVGAKDQTGQHPGGMVVVPKGMEIEDFTPCQFPANDPDAEFMTTHLDFNSLHDYILKFDILGHDMPTNLKILKDLTGVDPRDILFNDEKVLSLWYNTEGAIGIHHDEFMAKTGTLGLPEMWTRVVQDMITETNPRNFADLVALSGLSHGTDVYYNNAQNLFKNGICTLQDVIGCRDDIMKYLVEKGLEKSLAFTIMESVRKGKGLKDEWEQEMESKGVPHWYIDSCKKIKYMFPKAHAVAYVMDAVRMAHYKVYFALQFYAGQFSARYNELNVLEFLQDIPETKVRMNELEKEIKDLENQGEKNKASIPKRLRGGLNLGLEAKCRGFDFSHIRMYESDGSNYLIDEEEQTLIPPFSTIDGIGKKLAVKLAEAREDGVFRGIDDLKNRTKAKGTVVKENNIEALRQMGCLRYVESRQSRIY